MAANPGPQSVMHFVLGYTLCCCWLKSTFLTFRQQTWPSPKLKQRNLPGRRAKPAELQRERVSSQEEQIASALHDHIGEWPERGLCLPKGRLEWHGLVAQGGMWSSVTGTRVAWEAGFLFFCFALLCFSPPQPLFPASSH